MTTKNEALKLAIEQIKWADHLHDWHDGLYEALEACKSALEDETSSSDTAEMQEPVGYIPKSYELNILANSNDEPLGMVYPTKRDADDIPLYLHPAKNEASSSDIAEAQEPFGIWHAADDPDECDFFLYAESGDVSCDRCIKLYKHPAKPLKRLSEDEVEKVFQSLMIQFGRDYKMDIANAIMDAMEGKNK